MMHNKTFSFIIVAAGTGTRLGGIPKQFRMLNGQPIWMWSFKTAYSLLLKKLIADIIIVVSESHIYAIKKELGDYGNYVKVVPGGDTRSASVQKGLMCADGTHVLIHDAARPFVSVQLCIDIMKTCLLNDVAVIPVLQSVDSLKIIIDSDNIEPLNRDFVYKTQTPQLFNKESLLEFLKKSTTDETDEANLWIKNGFKLKAIKGEYNNFKITDKYDWNRAVLMTEKQIKQRVGHGFDIHKLVAGRKLVLAGVHIKESPLGLLAYSDGDVVFHAVMDSLLGAMGEADIGTLFPATDPKWKNADSSIMLKKVIKLLRSKSWKIDWVDITLIAQTPRLANRIEELKFSLFSYLKENDLETNVNLKLKSPEQCGSAGRSECIICHAIANISKACHYTNTEIE